MNGAEDDHITPMSGEPRWLRSLRNARTAFDLIFGAVLALVIVGAVVVLLLRPDLRDPQIIGLVAGALVTVGGLGLRRKS